MSHNCKITVAIPAGYRAGEPLAEARAVQDMLDNGATVYLASASGFEKVVGTVPDPNTRLIEGPDK